MVSESQGLNNNKAIMLGTYIVYIYNNNKSIMLGTYIIITNQLYLMFKIRKGLNNNKAIIK